MSVAKTTASADESYLEDDYFETNLAASRDDINRNVKDMFDECSRHFESFKKRQIKIESYLTIISDHCHKSSATGKEISILKLNIGGEDVNIRMKGIQQYGQHYNILSLLSSNPWDHRLTKNHKGRTFLNVNPAWITPIINLMREQSQTDSKNLSISTINVENEFGLDVIVSYYNFGPLPRRRCIISSGPSCINLMNTSFAMETLFSFLQPESIEGQHSDVNLDLIYRGSRDGYQPNIVKALCSGKDRQVIVVENISGNVYGGYYHNMQDNPLANDDTESFLFNLEGLVIPEKFASLGKLKFPWSPYSAHTNTINFGTDLCISGQNVLAYYFNGAFSSNAKASMVCFNTHGYNSSVREMEVYRITDLPVETEDQSDREVMVEVEAEEQLNQLSELGLSSPLHSWILDAVNSSGKVCRDFKPKLIYSSYRDGVTHSQFHEICDGKHLTVCIIKDSSGRTHGCFSDIPWSSTTASVTTANSFTFSFGGAVASYSRKAVSEVHFGPSHFISYGTDFKVEMDFRLSLVVDGVPVCAIHHPGYHYGGMPLLVADMAVYQIIPVVRKPRLYSMTFDVTALNDKIEVIIDTADEHIKKMALEVKEAEEKLLLDLLWIEHLSAPIDETDIKAGRKKEWQAIKDMARVLSADVSGRLTLDMLEEVMARLHITGSDSEGKVQGPDDEVVSYNVGGTIIAVLRSTLLRQAPNSAFASRFSGRWSEQDNEDMEDGYICLYDEDPVCFRRIISYLQLKDLLGDEAPKHIQVPQGSLTLQKKMLDFFCMADVLCIPFEA